MYLCSFKPYLVLLAYADWQNQANDQDQTTFAAVVGKTGKKWHGGIEVFTQTLKSQPGGNLSRQGISVFGAKKVRKNTKAFARVDVYDPNTDADNDRKSLIIGGVDIEPTKGIHFMPNVWIMADDRAGVDTTVMPRVTGYFKF